MKRLLSYSTKDQAFVLTETFHLTGKNPHNLERHGVLFARELSPCARCRIPTCPNSSL